MKYSLIRFNLVVHLLLAIISSKVAVAEIKNDKDNTKDEEKVHISPKCAAVLLTSGTVIGGTVTALALPSLGFTYVGVAKGSIAAWWQSTMPLVQGGSLFASLQSTAMTGGVGATVIITGSLGGAAAAAKLKRFCEIIDDIDPESKEGAVIDAMVMAQRKFGTAWSDIVDLKGKFIIAWDSIKDQVSSIELDPNNKIYNAWSDIKDQVSSINIDPNGNIQRIWNGMKEKVYIVAIDSEGKLGNMWNTVKDQASSIELDLNGNMETMWNKVKDHASNLDLDPNGKMEKLWKDMKDQASSAKDDAEGKISSFFKNVCQQAGF